MTDDQAFLNAIRLEPSDFTLRLVYADWLEERGDPRAEFLRVEDRLRRATAHDAGYPADLARWLELRERVSTDWIDALGPRVNGLPLPSDLAGLLAEGRWASASETDFRSTPWGEPYAYSLGAMRSETENVCFQMRWLGAPDADHPPGDIDPRLTVLIGDEGMGSDAPFALDYRTSFGHPRVLTYRWRHGGNRYEGNRWVEVASHFEA